MKHAAALLFVAGTALADIPHLNASGQADYREAYARAAAHRAFAIAPGGAWGWQGQAPTPEAAEEGALAACRANTKQQCTLYDSDGRVVFDARAWPRLWGPYADAATAARAPRGRAPGQRFPDVAFSSATGRALSLDGLRGKVVVLHFWGSWCRPCRRELPELRQLRDSLGNRRDITFVLLQGREPHAVAARWLREQGIALPLFDSGARDENDARFRLADGASIADRELAPGFPSTYVIDKRGIVVFAHVGDVHGWAEYRDFLLDAARHSGK